MRSPLYLPTSPAPESGDLDFLLAKTSAALQLTPTLHTKAEAHYHAVAEWLGAEGSALSSFTPKVYPQGSMALETTVRPKGGLEYDLDAVCQVDGFSGTAMDLYNAVHDRLAAHGTYNQMLSTKKRCLCLSHEGEFHLDIIPAIPDRRVGGTSILIPDRKLEEWSPSNPKGFVEWFKKKSATLLLEKRAKADAEALPGLRAVEDKSPLSVVIQLMKRARDIALAGHDDAPRSILLTTLAAHCYQGQPQILSASVDVLSRMRTVLMANPEGIEVVNPTNRKERFSDGLTDIRLKVMRDFVESLEGAMRRLTELRGLDQLQQALEGLFGERPAVEAISKYGELLKSRRDSGTLTYSQRGLAIVHGTTPARVKGNSYFGD